MVVKGRRDVVHSARQERHCGGEFDIKQPRLTVGLRNDGRTKYLLLHIFPAGIREELCIPRAIVLAPSILHHLRAQAHRTRPIVPDTLNGTWLHCLEADDHNDINDAAADKSSSKLKAGTASCAGIVGIIYGNIGHAELVKGTLARRCVAIAVTCHTCLDIIVCDVRIEKGFSACFKAQLRVWS